MYKERTGYTVGEKGRAMKEERGGRQERQEKGGERIKRGETTGERKRERGR